jgi:hypothetical protein
MTFNKQELTQAAVNGIHAYLRTMHGARALGASADVQLIGSTVIHVVHDEGIAVFELKHVGYAPGEMKNRKGSK